MMNHLSRLSADLIFFTTQETGFMRLADPFVTGSSIMPQKRNPDLCEVVQAKTAHAHGTVTAMLALGKGILSGYNRELQWSKYAVMDLVHECMPALQLLARAVKTIEVDKARLAACAEEGFLQAVDLADWLAQHRGLSFRQAYKVSVASVDKCRKNGVFTLEAVNKSLPARCTLLSAKELEQITDLQKCLKGRNHKGAPSPANVRQLAKRFSAKVNENCSWSAKTLKKLEKACSELHKAVEEIIGG